ncbi:serine/threonine-protein kinase pakF [Solea solea]|uniref:serine/threonine-protein kinase pakF n=1 Tax=Solea solea TaxID=90069 RepID=UPI00272CD2B5|nr:serine/threonine-protein kinase pakF [Solea solea]XP_058476596.1 serine/threonine-protein kinase pakF [Solea solea]
MAIPRVFNSNTPFIIVAGGSELSFLGKEESSQGREEEKDSLVQAIAPHLSRAMQHGTAKHVVTEGHEVEDPCVSIVAQAEREDFQEFSPTGTQGSFSRSQQLKKLRSVSQESAFVSDTEDEDLEEAAKLPHYHLQRKQRRKARARQSQEDGEQPPVICGLWVQEIDWLKSLGTEAPSSAEIIPPPPQFTDLVSSACSHGGRHLYVRDVRTLEEVSPSVDQYRSNTSSPVDRGGSDSDCGPEQDSESVCTYDSDSDSSCCAEDDTQAPEKSRDEAKISSNSPLDLMRVSGFNSNHADWYSDSSGCVESLLGLSDSSGASSTANTSQQDVSLEELRGRVTQMPKSFVSPFFEDLIKYNLKDWRHGVPLTEGLIFHEQLQPSSCQYREGEEYCILHHIQNGSYGDVFCVRDKRTGFECAAKRIPLSHFSGEEVSTWSALNSSRVVELFGAVSEGLNVVLFMDLKPACLAQLLKEMNSLPEDLSLHYLHQTLGALEHLHHKQVLHLDVKVDNVLLSADCRDTFLCDFGLSQTLDDSGQSTKAFRGTAFPGTQTHMAPEVARGDRLCAKADVWSSCCMLLHMLNGCHPWIRYYSHPLCLQIVNEPPPLWEVPSTCNNFTAKVFRAGLQKDPDRRASAKELRRKTTQALRAVGGLNPWSLKNAREILHRGKNAPSEDTQCSLSPGKTPNKPSAAASAPTMHWVSPWRTTAVEEDGNDREDGDSDLISEVEVDSFKMERDSQPKSLRDDYAEKDWDTESDSDVDMYMGEEEFIQEKWLKMDRDYEGDWEEEGQEDGEEDEEWDSSVSTEYHRALRGLFPLLQKGQANDSPWGSEAELEYLRDDVAIGAMIQTPSPEPRDDPPSCFSCSETSQIDVSEKDSDHSSDDLSSGVFSSCNSQTGGHLEWMAAENKPHLHCFQGVDIWIENVQGECLRIREHRQVKVGHVAVGISEQISGKAFTLETLDRKMVSFDQEIKESCVWFRFVPAPDTCRRWRWRVRDGKLELQE